MTSPTEKPPVTLLKLGGSFLTDKTTLDQLHHDRVRWAGREIARALERNPALRIVLGHGAGSFGHILAKHYQAVEGAHPEFGWRGYHEIRRSMARMNLMLLELWAEAGLQAATVAPSAVALADDGRLVHMDLTCLDHLISSDQIPVIHGEVILDRTRGFTIISTENQFLHLADRRPLDSVIMVTDVPGILDQQSRLIPEITPGSLADGILGGAAADDVTGGMRHKVDAIFRLLSQHPNATARILSGLSPDGTLADALTGLSNAGTLLRR